jgi:hypothetical protein
MSIIELQPLNDWKYALSPEGRKNPFIPDLHVLLAFKKDTLTSPTSTSAPQSPSAPFSLDHILSPSGSPTMSPHLDTNSHKLKGGIIFEYYSDINCGLFNYLIIKRKHRNKVSPLYYIHSCFFFFLLFFILPPPTLNLNWKLYLL